MPAQNDEEARQLQLLEALEEQPEVRQADLAAQLGVAVGTVNWLIKRLASKGYVKVQRIGQWNWRYLLTPRGFAEKARLTQRYIQNSMRLYREARAEVLRLLGEVRDRGYGRVRLEGDSENAIVDVCRLTCLEQGIEVVDAGDSAVPTLRVEGREIRPCWPQRGSRRIAEKAEMGEKLEEIIRRIVEVADPERIILFGSAVRGEQGPNSDLDLLVVKAGVHRRKLAQEIYQNMFGVGQAVDVIVATPDDLERYRDTHALVYKPALGEGKVVYERRAARSG